MSPLVADDTQLWLANLDVADRHPEDLARTLSPDELRRADAFCYARDRRRFVVGRALLRRLLAAHVRADPAAISFAYGPHGKPELAEGGGRPALQFNCSRSGPLALYAVTAGRRIGIDLEGLRPLPEAAAIAKLCFSPREQATLARLRQDALVRAILQGWTLKEAYLKATGDGLALPPERVEVAVASNAAPVLCTADGDIALASRWSFRSFTPVAGYTAALAVERCPSGSRVVRSR